MSTHDPRYEVVYPEGRPARGLLAVGAGLDDLSGKTVAELWDWFFRGDEMFPVIRERLRERYPGIKFVDFEVFGSTHGPHEAKVIAGLPGLLREQGVDAVISAVGA